MELFEGFLMIYAIVFYKDIENLPAKMKVKRRNPHGEYKNMTAVKMR